jgi:hypothetical protein
MGQYKRLTDKDGATRAMSQWAGTLNELKIYRRLAELEDKIENGTLVPKYSVVKSGNTYCACMVDTSKLLVIDEYETKAEAEKRLNDILGD